MTMEKDRTPATLIKLGERAEKPGYASPGYNEGDGLMVEMLAACISNQIQVPMGGHRGVAEGGWHGAVENVGEAGRRRALSNKPKVLLRAPMVSRRTFWTSRPTNAQIVRSRSSPSLPRQ